MEKSGFIDELDVLIHRIVERYQPVSAQKIWEHIVETDDPGLSRVVLLMHLERLASTGVLHNFDEKYDQYILKVYSINK